MGRPGEPHRGGTAGLAAFLREHQAALEADLLRFYGLDLAELGTDRLTWRRLWVLIEQLPPESATIRARLGEAAGWGALEHLTAVVADHLAVANWQRANTGKPKGQQSRPPAPLQRPGTGKPRRTLAELRALRQARDERQRKRTEVSDGGQGR